MGQQEGGLVSTYVCCTEPARMRRVLRARLLVHLRGLSITRSLRLAQSAPEHTFWSNGGVHLPAVCAHRIEAGELFGFTQGASDTNPNGKVPSVSPIDPSDHFARPRYDRQSRQSRPGPLLLAK